MPAVAHPVRDHCLAPDRSVDSPIAPVGGRYGRAFPDLPALESDQAALLALGSSGGLCDGSDATGDDGTAAAGWPFFGQFIAHDITADRSPIGPHADATTIANFRSPRANLECLYGAGPVGAPFLYDARDPAKLLRGDGDVARNAQGTALLGDPRNDVHVFISQLHHALIGAHNRLVDRLREDGVAPAECFDAARRAAMWHYQWVIVEDFLVALVGRDLVEEVKDPERRHFRPEGTPIIPFEFADAAFRYGHGQIRHRYRLQDGGGEYAVFPDLVGFHPVAPEHRIDWRLLLGPEAQPAKRMDGRLAASLIGLPLAITRRRRRRGLSLARGTRPAARRRHRPALRRGGGARDRCRAAHARRGRAGGVRVAGRDAAVALRAARGRRARRRRAPRRGRRTPRGRGAAGPARRRPRVLPRRWRPTGSRRSRRPGTASACSTCSSAPP